MKYIKNKKGTMTHLKDLIQRMYLPCDRPRINGEDRAIIAALCMQELLRRRIISSDRDYINKRYRLNVDMLDG